MRWDKIKPKKTRQIAAQLLRASRNVHQLLDDDDDDHRGVDKRVQVGLPPHGAENRRRHGRRGRCAEAARGRCTKPVPTACLPA